MASTTATRWDFIDTFQQGYALLLDSHGVIFDVNAVAARTLNQQGEKHSCRGIHIRDIATFTESREFSPIADNGIGRNSVTENGKSISALRCWNGDFVPVCGTVHTVTIQEQELLLWLGTERLREQEQCNPMAETQTLAEVEARLIRFNRALADLAREQSVHVGDIRVALRKIALSVTDLLEADRFSAWFFSETREELICAELYIPKNGTHSSGDAIICAYYPEYFTAIERDRLLISSSASTDERLRDIIAGNLQQHGTNAVLDVGILSAGELIGIMSVELSAKKEWRIEEIAFMQAVAETIAVASENYFRNKAEQELRESRARFERISAATSDGLWEISFRDNYRYVSEQLKLLWELQVTDEVFWKTWFRQIPKADFRYLTKILRRHIERDTPLDVEFRIDTPSGQKWLQAKGKVYRDEQGKPLLLSGSVRDITLRRNAEERLRSLNQELEERVKKRTSLLNQLNLDLERALAREQQFSEMKTKFVTMLSHEFRTPLTIVQSGVGLLESAITKGKAITEEQITTIATRVRRGTEEMVALLEATSRLISIQTLLLTARPRLSDLVPECRKIVLFASQRTQREITLHAPDKVSLYILPELVVTALEELLDNAVKYSTPDTTIEVFIIAKNEHEALVEVLSYGQPINTEEQNRIFELFQRGHAQFEVGRERGLGIGLGIVAMCADALGGYVFTRSEAQQRKNVFGFGITSRTDTFVPFNESTS